MNWASWQAFADMGGHGRFVWGSFGVVALGLLIEWVRLQRQDEQLRRGLRQRWLQEHGDGFKSEGHHHFEAAFGEPFDGAFHEGVRP